mmetsp:Transcript_12571/g.26614  ORF Transcript_12571/g.26614 Transcript_12571/m.26614 type:complete len:210 (-) Transcript_12571:50-679(-)
MAYAAYPYRAVLLGLAGLALEFFHTEWRKIAAASRKPVGSVLHWTRDMTYAGGAPCHSWSSIAAEAAAAAEAIAVVLSMPLLPVPDPADIDNSSYFLTSASTSRSGTTARDRSRIRVGRGTTTTEIRNRIHLKATADPGRPHREGRAERVEARLLRTGESERCGDDLVTILLLPLTFGAVLTFGATVACACVSEASKDTCTRTRRRPSH